MANGIITAQNRDYGSAIDITSRVDSNPYYNDKPGYILCSGGQNGTYEVAVRNRNNTAGTGWGFRILANVSYPQYSAFVACKSCIINRSSSGVTVKFIPLV